MHPKGNDSAPVSAGAESFNASSFGAESALAQVLRSLRERSLGWWSGQGGPLGLHFWDDDAATAGPGRGVGVWPEILGSVGPELQSLRYDAGFAAAARWLPEVRDWARRRGLSFELFLRGEAFFDLGGDLPDVAGGTLLMESTRPRDYDHFRGPGSFQRLFQFLERLDPGPARSLALRLPAVVPNLARLEQSLAFAAARGFSRLELILQAPRAEGPTEAWERPVARSELEARIAERGSAPLGLRVVDEGAELSSRRDSFLELLWSAAISERKLSCPVLGRSLRVSPSGEVYPCPRGGEGKLRVGQDCRSVGEAWKSVEMRVLVSSHAGSEFPDICSTCGLRV